MSGIVLHHGDCRDILGQMRPESVDLVLADPPYGQTGLAWDRRVRGWLPLAHKALKPTGTLWLFGSLKSFISLADELRQWQLIQDVIWEKQNGSGFDNQRFRRVHEQVAQFRKRGTRWSSIWREPQFTMDAKKRSLRAKATRIAHTGDIGPHIYTTEDGGPRLMRSVIGVRNTHRQGTGHPTAKPVELLSRIIAYSCPPDGLIVDPFAGSGSTGVAAIEQGRRATLIEADAEYVAVIRNRCGLLEEIAA